jgi:FlaA1/EpsC-like NDP-sugar epimerase
MFSMIQSKMSVDNRVGHVNMITLPTTRDTMRVQNKSIIVTGAGSGIGEGIVKRLAAQGANVIVNDINTALGEKVVASIVQAGGTAAFFAADVTQSAERGLDAPQPKRA